MKHPDIELVFNYSQPLSCGRRLLFTLLVLTAPSKAHTSVVSYSSMPSISAVRWLADTQSKPGHRTVAQLIRMWFKEKVLTEFTPPRSVQPRQGPANTTSREKQLHFCYFFHAKTILFQSWRWKREFILPSRTRELHTISEFLFICFIYININLFQIGIKKVVIPGISEFTVQRNICI